MIAFIISFILYLRTLFPHVAQYRDSGEMVTVAHTLGVAHPPGYPLYALIGKISLFVLPWGSHAYRMNVLSALAGAATAGVLYLLLRRLSLGKIAATMLSLIFATSYLQWYLSLVSEMYTLNTLFTACIFLIVFALMQKSSENVTDLPLFWCGVFLFGAGLGNRMDLLLMAPAFPMVFWQDKRYMSPFSLFTALLIFAAGYSIFLYLPLRSLQQPLLDWNHPANLSSLWSSITRKTHGGTLDLISSSYAPGENFPATIRFYFAHLFSGFAYAGLPLGIFGAYRLVKTNRAFAAAAFIAWLMSGPVFIYLANIPPNPHALAVLEAHFLLPNLIYFIWIAAGFAYLINSAVPGLRFAAPAAGVVLLTINIVHHFPQLDKRENFVGYDYSKNILRSLPYGAMAAMKEDVQLFSLWNRQFVEKEREDLAIISQGLAGSPWYQKTWQTLHPGVRLFPLNEASGWQALIENNPGRNIYFSQDADYHRPAGCTEEPHGLLNRIVKNASSRESGILLDHIYAYRGNYISGDYREFFTPDLIEDYAKARFALGQHFYRQKEFDRARKEFARALRLQPILPMAENFTAFSHLEEGRYERAKVHYQRSAELFQTMRALAVRYNSAAGARESLSSELSDVYISLGVCFEKTRRDDESLKYYAQAAAVNPGNARAYFNSAVIYWRQQDWPLVIKNLEEALRIDPNNSEAAFYLQQARQKIN